MGACERRRLFVRDCPEHPLTPPKLRLLLYVAECSVLTPPQLAGLSGMSLKAVRNHLRDLYDLGMVERSGVPRAALAHLETPNTPDLLWGRAPTIYTLSKEGAKALVQAGLVSKADVGEIPEYGPKNSLFLAHELQVRDVRVWLEQVKRAYGHPGVERWVDGTRAVIELGREQYPRQARPDAWFTYRFQEATLMGMVEVDRGTERSPSRWHEKFAQYAPLLCGDMVQELTGQKQGRVLVICPNEVRREAVASLLEGLLPASHVPPDRFWLASRATLEGTDLRHAIWRVAGRATLMPLVPERLI